MKYFITSDIHGFYSEMMDALNEAGFDKSNPMHTFVSLGDLLDRGEEPLKCLQFVNSLERKILIRGNHEDLMEEALARQEFKMHDWHNGTAQTAYTLYPDDYPTEDRVIRYMRGSVEYAKYIDSTRDYYDDGKNVFVHGWIPCKKLENSPLGYGGKYIFFEDWKNGDWKSARWINGMSAWYQGVHLCSDDSSNWKTIYCGHWHTSWGHHHTDNSSPEWNNKYSTNAEHRKADFSPFVKEGIVALDACTAYSHKVNCYVVDYDECDKLQHICNTCAVLDDCPNKSILFSTDDCCDSDNDYKHYVQEI